MSWRVPPLDYPTAAELMTCLADVMSAPDHWARSLALKRLADTAEEASAAELYEHERQIDVMSIIDWKLDA